MVISLGLTIERDVFGAWENGIFFGGVNVLTSAYLWGIDWHIYKAKFKHLSLC